MANITLSTLYNRVKSKISSSWTYSEANFLEDIHFIAQDFWSEVVAKKKWTTNWDIWYADTVSLQDEYTYPFVSSTTVWAEYIEDISVNFDWLTYDQTWLKQFIHCSLATVEQISNWEYYLEHQSKNNPIYFERDWSIFIAPDIRSNEVWTWRLKITWIRSLDSWNWTTTTSETDIKLPIHALETLSVWCIRQANSRWRLNRSELEPYRNDYEKAKQDSVFKLSNWWPFILEFPD